MQNQLIIFTGFIVFEVCVGIFWPALGMMRGKYVPEASEFEFMLQLTSLTRTSVSM